MDNKRTAEMNSYWTSTVEMGVPVISVKEIWISWSGDVLPDVKMLFIRIKTFETHFGTFERVPHKIFLVRNHFLARYVNQNYKNCIYVMTSELRH